VAVCTWYIDRVKRSILIFLTLAASLVAADKDFNGRWDITVPENDRRRAWWLEVKNAETGKPVGTFISAYAGDLNPFDEASIENGELHLTFRSRGNKPQITHLRARLINGKLEGTREVDGNPTKLAWTGVRAPKFKTIDPKKLKEGKPVELFNGRDLTGWRPLRPERKIEWTVKDGVTANVPGAVDLVTEQKFWNFKLHAEYRVGPKSNSGIGLRGRYEVQILEDYGQPPNSHGNGALYSRILPTQNASKPANEWQTFDITIIENRVTVVLNGVNVIDNKEIDGLTAIGIDPDESKPGPIIVQGDHGAVEFRKLTLTPLT
jgi:Domain of Unknown Function (DUF1080)